MATQLATKETAAGWEIHWAGRYDLLTWLITLGRERRLRERMLEPARLQPGERVLDVGCGTGSTALVAKRQVGPGGSVAGIDASAPMLARARRKTRRAGLDVDFRDAKAQALPFGDATFDVVLNTVMLHHVRRADRPAVFREMHRVLVPGGRLLIADFATGGKPRTLVGRMHRNLKLTADHLVDLATAAGFTVTASAPVGAWDLQYVTASRL